MGEGSLLSVLLLEAQQTHKMPRRDKELGLARKSRRWWQESYLLMMFTPAVFPLLQAPHQPGQPGFKFTVAESCDRIKDEFQFLQAQYHR